MPVTPQIGVRLMYPASGTAVVPTNQTQLNVSGLQSGTRYGLYVSGSVMWNGTQASRDNTKYFTVQ